jgi:hypothetical protein
VCPTSCTSAAPRTLRVSALRPWWSPTSDLLAGTGV